MAFRSMNEHQAKKKLKTSRIALFKSEHNCKALIPPPSTDSFCANVNMIFDSEDDASTDTDDGAHVTYCNESVEVKTLINNLRQTVTRLRCRTKRLKREIERINEMLRNVTDIDKLNLNFPKTTLC